MSYDENEKIIRDVYVSVIDNFGIDFSTNSNGYYPKGGKKTLFEEHAIYGKRTSIESYKDRGYKHLYEKIIHVEEAGFVNFVKKGCVKVENIRTNQ